MSFKIKSLNYKQNIDLGSKLMLRGIKYGYNLIQSRSFENIMRETKGNFNQTNFIKRKHRSLKYIIRIRSHFTCFRLFSCANKNILNTIKYYRYDIYDYNEKSVFWLKKMKKMSNFKLDFSDEKSLKLSKRIRYFHSIEISDLSLCTRICTEISQKYYILEKALDFFAKKICLISLIDLNLRNFKSIPEQIRKKLDFFCPKFSKIELSSKISLDFSKCIKLNQLIAEINDTNIDLFKPSELNHLECVRLRYQTSEIYPLKFPKGLKNLKVSRAFTQREVEDPYNYIIMMYNSLSYFFDKSFQVENFLVSGSFFFLKEVYSEAVNFLPLFRVYSFFEKFDLERFVELKVYFSLLKCKIDKETFTSWTRSPNLKKFSLNGEICNTIEVLKIIDEIVSENFTAKLPRILPEISIDELIVSETIELQNLIAKSKEFFLYERKLLTFVAQIRIFDKEETYRIMSTFFSEKFDFENYPGKFITPIEFSEIHAGHPVYRLISSKNDDYLFDDTIRIGFEGNLDAK